MLAMRRKPTRWFGQPKTPRPPSSPKDFWGSRVVPFFALLHEMHVTDVLSQRAALSPTPAQPVADGELGGSLPWHPVGARVGTEPGSQPGQRVRGEKPR